MRRRAAIHSPKSKRAARWGVVAIVLCVVALCAFEFKHVGVGQTVASTRESIVHWRGGALLLSEATYSPPTTDTATPGTSLGWDFSIDPGLYGYLQWMTSTGGSGTTGAANPGTSRGVQRTLHVTTWMLLLSGTLLFCTIPLRKVPEGECVCGYTLEGIGGDVCPECGEKITPAEIP